MNLHEHDRLLDGLARPWDTMLLLADAAEEGGDEELALGWRWLAENGRWPIVSCNAKPFIWCGDSRPFSTFGKEYHNAWALPDEVLGTTKDFERLPDALLWAARAVGKALAEAPAAATANNS